jgi:hypothetical protein
VSSHNTPFQEADDFRSLAIGLDARPAVLGLGVGEGSVSKRPFVSPTHGTVILLVVGGNGVSTEPVPLRWSGALAALEDLLIRSMIVFCWSRR